MFSKRPSTTPDPFIVVVVVVVDIPIVEIDFPMFVGVVRNKRGRPGQIAEIVIPDRLPLAYHQFRIMPLGLSA